MMFVRRAGVSLRCSARARYKQCEGGIYSMYVCIGRKLKEYKQHQALHLSLSVPYFSSFVHVVHTDRGISPMESGLSVRGAQPIANKRHKKLYSVLMTKANLHVMGI